ncbi:hypothetical protein C8024_07330 [Sphingopyxis sp. BSNA05]|uniref:DUF4328 domain-containing protein n=1 Tax=Sphingopyxis sp. BSNA05 TaxID=1236614 RepID=UPI001563D124|nr:DUF4328 domain-containing protein [Sphingopyxis sp. BSNA05]NRD89295.1 hypothetical protein [Sphingopyxis sp. BSNA05]
MAEFQDDGVEILLRRSRLLVYLLIAGLVATAMFFLFELSEITGFWVVDVNDPFNSPLGIIYGITGLTHSLIYFVTVIVFSMWIHRAAHNIVTADIDGFSYTPGWAVGWFFIPFANLFKPFQAMRQIWNASHGASGFLNEGSQTVTIWWSAWLVVTISGNISLRLTVAATDAEQLMWATQIGAISSVASFLLFPAAIRLVKDITRAQTEYLQINALAERFA